MSDYSQFVKRVLSTGATASAATSLAASLCGVLEDGHAVAPLNAVSHIVWDDEATRQTKLSFQYTATGVALNAAAVTSWAVLYELCCGRVADNCDIAGALLGGAAVSATAYLTDYHVVPRRWTPGFEHQLSNRSLLGIYTALAVGLAAGSLLQSGRMLSPLAKSRTGH